MKIEIKNGKLSITDIDVTAKAITNSKPSKKGKSKILATTSGFTAIEGGPDGLKVSLNVIVPIE
jgi:hypothetical protein